MLIFIIKITTIIHIFAHILDMYHNVIYIYILYILLTLHNFLFNTTYSRCLFVRWAKLRASVLPVCMLLEPVSECLLLGLAIAWSLAVLLKWSPVGVLFMHCLIWFLLDYVLIRTIQVGAVEGKAWARHLLRTLGIYCASLFL